MNAHFAVHPNLAREPRLNFRLRPSKIHLSIQTIFATILAFFLAIVNRKAERSHVNLILRWFCRGKTVIGLLHNETIYINF